MVALDGGPRPAAAPLDLAALHGERDVVAARVAGDELQLGAEDGVHRLREDVGIGARAGAADEDGARVEVLEARDSGLAHDAHTLTSSLALPSQPNSAALNCAPSVPSSGSKAMPRPMVPNTVPSRGAALYSQLASRRLPAPSMFFDTITGLPGRCRPICRARRRA